MGLMDRVPVSVVRWAGREQFRVPLLGRMLRPAAARLRRKPRVVPHGQAKGLVINPSGANPGYALGTSEPLVQDAFAEHVPNGGVVWDVGANVGFYTLIASRLVGDGKVVAFEPLPVNRDALRRNLALNGMANVEVSALAIGSHDGHARLEHRWSSGRADLQAKLDVSEQVAGAKPADSEAAEYVDVEMGTLDSQLERFPAPSLLKMDIEGGEVGALEGASELLSKHRPTVICEFHGTNGPVTDLLEGQGYSLCVIEMPDVPPRDAPRNVHVLAIPAGGPDLNTSPARR
jgi:FkbM family methyltransferase